MKKIKKNYSLKELQEYMKQLCEKRNWDQISHLEKFLLFSEEVGELAKAIREFLSIGVEKKKNKKEKKDLKEEFADVLNYFLDLANGFDIDLQEAFLLKDRKNMKRMWF